MKKQKLTEFELKVLKKLEKVPRGRVTTYKLLAQAVEKPCAARAVGNALHENPWAPRVPCHRVVRSDGRLGGYGGGIKRKIELLKKEGVAVSDGKIRGFTKIIYKFK